MTSFRNPEERITRLDVYMGPSLDATAVTQLMYSSPNKTGDRTSQWWITDFYPGSASLYRSSQWRKPGPQLGGDEKKFAVPPKFRNFFLGGGGKKLTVSWN